MFKKIRIKLTFLFFLMTSIIFLIMGIANASLYEYQLKKQYSSNFSELSHSIIYHLKTETTLNYHWLMQTEYSNNTVVHIEDNGVPLSFKGYYLKGEARRNLVSLAKTSIKEENIITPLSSKQSGHYYGVLQSLPTPTGNLQVILLKDISPMYKQLTNQRLSTSLSILLGELSILILSWCFVGKILVPVERARIKQSDFVASASHELRSPITVIKTSLSALEIAPEQSRSKFLNIAQKESDRMSKLLNDLLILANFDQCHIHGEVTENDLAIFLMEIYEKFDALAHLSSHNLNLAINLEGLPPLICDFYRLNQLLCILIDNALTYTPPSSSITISSKYAKHKLYLAVIDNGPGIPPKYQEQVFDRFFSIDPSHSKKEHGGLGLSIAKEIATHHGWKLSLTTTPGGGATFLLILPI